jgi:hypothetical protein
LRNFLRKKSFWNTDLSRSVFRSVFPFFQRAKSPPKQCYIILKKIWGDSPYGLVFLGTKNGYPYRMNFGEKWLWKMENFEIFCEKFWKILGSKLKIFDFLRKYIRVVKWAIWASGAPFRVLCKKLMSTQPQCKNQSKNFRFLPIC